MKSFIVMHECSISCLPSKTGMPYSVTINSQLIAVTIHGRRRELVWLRNEKAHFHGWERLVF